MDQNAWRQLLDELSLYIDENYVGVRLIPFPGETVGAAPDCADSPQTCERIKVSVADNETHEAPFEDIFKIFSRKCSAPPAPADVLNVDEILESFESTETFSEALLRIIKEKDLVEADVYNRVFMDRKLFNKIRNDRTYQPSKRTAILLSVALRLSVTETQEFLEKAGFALTHASKTDIIIEFFMMRGNYDVIEINAALYEHRLPPLNK